MTTNEVPEPRAHHIAVVVANSMFVFGGIHKNDLWVFDFESNIWKQVDAVTRVPCKRHGHSATVSPRGDGFFIFGGYAFENDLNPDTDADVVGGPLDDLWFYDIVGNTWTLLHTNHPKGGRTYASMVVFNGNMVNNMIYIRYTPYNSIFISVYVCWCPL